MNNSRHICFWIGALCFVLLFSSQTIHADATVTKVCPTTGIQQNAVGYQPGGVILTAFDKSALWVYNIDSGRRYPLPDTAPCSTNCHLSPDAIWLTYFNDPTNAFNIMHLDGTAREFLTDNAAEISWWDPATYLVWTPGKQAYIQPIGSGNREYLDVTSVISVQPGGRYGLLVQPKGDGFERSLINLQMRDLNNVSDNPVDLGVDKAYFDAQSWSPDGKWLAYVAPVDAGNGQTGSEIFAIQPGSSAPTQWTHLTSLYGAARINGLSVGELSWSPDGTRIAFWVSEITGPDYTANLGNAVIHILDVATGNVNVYCAFASTMQTPNPPRLVWSPDGTNLAFGGALPNDNSGYYLLAMDVQSGAVTALSQGVVPVFGAPDVVAWGKLAS